MGVLWTSGSKERLVVSGEMGLRYGRRLMGVRYGIERYGQYLGIGFEAVGESETVEFGMGSRLTMIFWLRELLPLVSRELRNFGNNVEVPRRRAPRGRFERSALYLP